MELRLEIVPRGFLAAMEVQSTLLDKIREAQKEDKEIVEIRERMGEGKAKGFREDEHDTLWFDDRIYVPNNSEIRKLILQEAHDSPYSIHPRNTKMYLDWDNSISVPNWNPLLKFAPNFNVCSNLPFYH